MQSRRFNVLILILAILTFTVAVSAVGFWKYTHYRYQGMDLAIYTNVLHQMDSSPSFRGGARGGVGVLGDEGAWHSSIQGSSYLGDHVEPILLLLAPLFRLWSDPRLLIVLQALALGLTAIPISLLLSNVSSSRAQRSGVERSPDERSEISPLRSLPARFGRNDARGHGHALFLTVIWLMNPLLWNAALFEFHALAFAPFLLLSAAYAYVRRRFWWFLLWMVLSFGAREDVALVVVMFGMVALVGWRMERRGYEATIQSNNKTRTTEGQMPSHSDFGLHSPHASWMLTPLILGLAWFFLSTRIAAAHSTSGAYKFLIYYGWLRDVFAHPVVLLQHIVSIGNIDMTLGLLLPFLFLPLLRPRWLLLALPPLLQILLSAPGGSSVVVETHYALLFLPALALATVEVIVRLPFIIHHSSFIIRWFPLPRPFAIGLGIATYLAAAWMIGPFPGIANVVIHGASAEDRVRRAAYDELLARVPSDAPIAAGYAALPHVATRTGAYSLAYAYLGVNQYAFAPYELPDTTRYLLLDQRDAITYAVQFHEVGWSAPHAAEGPARLRRIIADGRFGIIAERDGIALLERGVATAASDGVDQRYLAPDHPVRGRLIIDSLRDTARQTNGE